MSKKEKRGKDKKDEQKEDSPTPVNFGKGLEKISKQVRRNDVP